MSTKRTQRILADHLKLIQKQSTAVCMKLWRKLEEGQVTKEECQEIIDLIAEITDSIKHAGNCCNRIMNDWTDVDALTEKIKR